MSTLPQSCETPESIISLEKLSAFSDEYKSRRRQQMLRFFGASILTLITARLAFHNIKTRKYVPTLFQNNYKIPPFSYQKESLSALAYGTFFSVGGFGMLIFGGCWMANISTLPEFSYKLRCALLGEEGMRELYGREQTLKMNPMDKDTKEILDLIENAFDSSKKK
ncbi:related to Altered inheritance of mitochondria protein 11 [Saccharomycodes ludwigii]|uniref:Altered inheritance of mitochondria protein 11 n=1 Tax=Saccharomycodes ludwigii TaxID=36035 RepID=A0A376BAL8_9ASCO|nr:hypothetical protein SCDLUD_000195 [Saccharomycodes ludwigii]KAH3902615.1 hypothetical protein SCDLUD_000195 [Saccharomycodes ludwigii]SSD61180.1 related to Altered inheritance of mitochondria protein 11 [Saccharomycodes ludwigii]